MVLENEAKASKQSEDIFMSCADTVCIVCQKSFINNKRLQIHLNRKHSVRNDQKVTKEYKCDKCDKVYTTRANLFIHERTHTGCVAVY